MVSGFKTSPDDLANISSGEDKLTFKDWKFYKSPMWTGFELSDGNVFDDVVNNMELNGKLGDFKDIDQLQFLVVAYRIDKG